MSPDPSPIEKSTRPAAQHNPRNWRLYAIFDTGYAEPARAGEIIGAMAEGGVDVVQLRAKGLTENELLPIAKLLRSATDRHALPLIINDHPEIASACGADGVHVGQDDSSVALARSRANGLIVGKSTHSIEQARKATAEGADYIGFGPLFSTPTKPDYQPIGIADITEVHQVADFPIFCIGGVKLANLPNIVAAGALRVVIVSGILQADDIAAYCQSAKALLPG